MKFKQQFPLITMALLAVATVRPGVSAVPPDRTGATNQMVITVSPAHKGGSVPQGLQAGDVTVTAGKTNVPVVQLQRLAGSMADMQLFVYLDDSTRSSSLGTQLLELKAFLRALPATTQVAIGYMHNGTFGLAQAFTADHEKAAEALRLPASIPGVNGSPYFGISDLMKHWPSKEASGRRAVLVLTDGVDRYYDGRVEDDPYVDAAVNDALKAGVMVSSIFLRGAGLYGHGTWTTNIAQSRLNQVSQETGGHAYFQALSDPVSIEPFLRDFQDRLDHQYALTLKAWNGHGVQPVKLRTELPGVKLEGPSLIYLP